MNGEPLTTVNKFRQLAVTQQTTTKSFRCHIQERTEAAKRAIFTSPVLNHSNDAFQYHHLPHSNLRTGNNIGRAVTQRPRKD
ncbi:hypothetical protein ANN_26712 [Periplaneta americana]|uniref:Uncharacterized protein n=1 Tax=Periplaneta americana TaxID=6978 RepID=A0ABQ8RYU0_PERAM|nr:hypothetical protein ANN_26712 [Periplaneta americana]